ncbi:hypothetical protein [Bacillus xiapuensis]|uniref:Uncharacterized protein n=1 Tax=Bacillus xiapuensis TaxID=2014075 RepID=A0ABU6NEW7_9BACI|nr:hypothetical protein [Bacillus xiapuensis]
MSFEQYWYTLNKKNDELNKVLSSYWNHYSSITSWQFWMILALTLIPLIILFLKIDRKRIFELLFFGYTAHILWTYYNIALEKYGYLNHPYFLTPALPYALTLTASMLPVTFILLYQFCTNHSANYYLYTLFVSAIFAFILGPLEGHFKFAVLRNGMNSFVIFFSDILIAYLSYWFTKIMLKLRGKE